MSFAIRGILTMNRIGYLDGIRALAILSVLAVHWIASQLPIAYGGYIGVDLFFVLSGYIITNLLWRRNTDRSTLANYGRFLKRRVVRLYPALLAFVVLTLVIYAVFPGAPTRVSELFVPAALALTQGYSLYAGSGAATAAPFAITWSLSIEWMFYLVWPLVVFGCRRSGMGPGRLAAWTGTTAAVIYAASLFQDSHWFYYGPLARIPEIMVGGVLALLMVRSEFGSRTVRHERALAAGAILALAFIVLYSVFGPVQWSLLFRFFGLPATVAAGLFLIWYGRRLPESPLTRALSWAPLTFLGRVSYSLYLWHMVGLNLFTTDNLGDLPLPLVGIIAVSLAIALAGLSYRFLELPMLQTRPSRVASRSEASEIKRSLTPS
jgi:peptidoglycan/LPS O-acetylase OafA/YrhL